ncbi:MAG TPA: formate dehydrogenase accessory protein FdhE [Rhodopila sp.]
MRQGETAPKGAWTGSPLGGVKAPAALILPDPATRFARTAARLQTLASGHAMAEWLSFMAHLAMAQHAACSAMGAIPDLPLAAVERAVGERVAPLAADAHPPEAVEAEPLGGVGADRRHPAWRDGLTALLDSADAAGGPAAARAVVASLRGRSPEAVEALADGFLGGGVDASDTGALLYVAAALQVYFTRRAASLPAPVLRLLPQRGLCPCCGSTPVAGVVTEAGRSPGARYLHCSLCSTAWNHVRAVCITCGGSRSLVLQGIEGDPGVVKAETCGECHTYAKMLYQGRDVGVDPFADDLASLGLDILVAEAGWSRHAPNPLLLVG